MKILIGSPIYQKPIILIEFLESLKRLDKGENVVDYMLVDDNKIEQSKELLVDFKNNMKDSIVTLVPGTNNEEEYNCDSNTHHWRTNLIEKITEYKNHIINQAIVQQYDYLFLID